jgi:hypothetical protein
VLDTEIIVEDFLQSVDKRQGERQKLRYMRWQSDRSLVDVIIFMAGKNIMPEGETLPGPRT